MRLLTALWALLLAVAGPAAAYAQQGSEDCLRLESQLAALGRPAAPDPRKLSQMVAQQ